MGGYPGGYVYAIDNTLGVWYFVAPQHFISEVKKGYAKSLHFDLIQSTIDFQYEADDVVFSDGIDTLTFNTVYNFKTTWTSYAVKLDEFSGWKKGSSIATKTDMQTDLRIRGEFRAGPDRGGLDNVAIY